MKNEKKKAYQQAEHNLRSDTAAEAAYMDA